MTLPPLTPELVNDMHGTYVSAATVDDGLKAVYELLDRLSDRGSQPVDLDHADESWDAFIKDGNGEPVTSVLLASAMLDVLYRPANLTVSGIDSRNGHFLVRGLPSQVTDALAGGAPVTGSSETPSFTVYFPPSPPTD